MGLWVLQKMTEVNLRVRLEKRLWIAFFILELWDWNFLGLLYLYAEKSLLPNHYLHFCIWDDNLLVLHLITRLLLNDIYQPLEIGNFNLLVDIVSGFMTENSHREVRNFNSYQLSHPVFSFWVFFHEYSRFTGRQRKGGGYLFNSSLPLPPAL